MNGNQYAWILIGIYLVMASGALAGTRLQNVALNKKAVQSSQGNIKGAASGAVDGHKELRFDRGSCTDTNEETDPWWRVDLGKVYKVGAVAITNRDFSPNRLDGAEIWIGNSVETNHTTNIRCAEISHIPSGRTTYFPCSAVAGRYVTVLLPGSRKVLGLCEVEVFPVTHVYAMSNVALKGDATQSSTLSFADASKAIDGRRDSFYSHGFCSHTAENEVDPWWRLDLRGTFIVSSIKITNRGDCCAERLDGAEIRIGNSLENNGNNNSRCASISHIRAGKTNTYHCDGGSLEGRFVNVIIPGEGKTLTLCEVEVFAIPAVEPVPDVAFKKPTAQSLVAGFGWASNAVSGCKSGIYLEGCCTHTVSHYGPWWRVDLLAVHKVSAVSITNRRDCCIEVLHLAQIRIGNSPTYSRNPRCGTIYSTNGPSTHTFQCAGMRGRYVTVNIPRHTVLVLCDVQVFASPVPQVITPPPPPPPTVPPLPPSVTVQLSDKYMTVVGRRLSWSDALLFCRTHHWDLLSLLSQTEQSELEQLLSLSPLPLTHSVWLGLRRTVMDDRWFWMSGNSMDFTKWLQNSAPNHFSNPCGGVASGGLFMWDHYPCQTPLNFICQSRAVLGAHRVYYDTISKATPPSG